MRERERGGGNEYESERVCEGESVSVSERVSTWERKREEAQKHITAYSTGIRLTVAHQTRFLSEAGKQLLGGNCLVYKPTKTYRPTGATQYAQQIFKILSTYFWYLVVKGCGPSFEQTGIPFIQLCAKFGWKWQSGPLNFVNIFLLLLPLRKGCGSSFEQTWIPFSLRSFVLSLVEIGFVVLEKMKKADGQMIRKAIKLSARWTIKENSCVTNINWW